ncbi:DNA alkylation repair protein [Clostridiisalibacter paucivorans]|uniref:DNA alkylation repair protein n=1 Tax=Clostridiisalibacter paucivorans TaxID=408753 RepID=UPI0005590056|nr:DNA alkylation repair protein [Clostridiisalibacter paucivorans]
MSEEIIKKFYDNGNEFESKKMAKYMRNKFLFLGIKRPERLVLQKGYIKQCKRIKKIDWDFIFKLWKLPEREFQYLAVDILVALKKEIKNIEIDKIEKLTINRSWWDTVDFLSSKITADVLDRYPDYIEETIIKWSESNDIWLSRSSILVQLRYKEKTNLKLLSTAILNNINSDEFFINKAIGWALREYSKTDKFWVKDFIKNNKLHPLSIKEGSKYL